MKRSQWLRSPAVAMAAAIIAGTAVTAEAAGPRPGIRDLVLGQPSWAQPADFQEFACGTNGGPPSLRLDSFADAGKCRPEPSGLREVQFRYDDEAYYLALTQRDELRAEVLQDSKLGDFSILASGLFDNDGVLRGIRAVTDDRVPDRARRQAHRMAVFVHMLYRDEGWTCEDVPPAAGEEPVGNVLIKRDCRKVTDDGYLVLTEQRYLRRPGQSIIDPANGQLRPSLFVSTSRFELYQADADGRPILGGSARPVPPPDEAAIAADDREGLFLAGRTIDCPGCDLAGADLKRRVLAGANLAGANLAGATLHRANLERAVLDGANLAGANLNLANLARASLVGADLSGALLYKANGAAADFSRAILDRTIADEARFTAGRLSGVQWSEASAVAASLAGSDLRSARLKGTNLSQADLQRADLAKAELTDAILFEARLRAATLTSVDAAEADFRRADMTDVKAAGATLTGASLQGALTTGLDLSGASLGNAVMPDGRAGR